jgi:GNAT superfamily N-acetyltransferase
MSDIVYRDLAPGEAGWLIEQHALLYGSEEGFDASFEALVAHILADFIDNHRAPVERAWIAWEGSVRLGSIFCVYGPDADTAKLRLFLLVPEARGRGLGQQLLTLCLDHARAHGFKRLTLWTHESHRVACALYTKAGFTCATSKPVRSFGVDLVEQEWTIDLTA